MSGPQKPANHSPAPWKLTGEGIIFAYRFNKKWVEENGFFNSAQKGNFKGGLGFVMLVSYHSSPIGPYKELLFIPGKFGPQKKKSITRIFVDSEESTENGRFNWGIPKETVPMIWQKNSKEESIGIGHEDDPIFFCKITSGGISFPVSTKLIPIHLYQELEGKIFLTDPSGSGWGKFAKIVSLKINEKYFPNIKNQKPLLCIKVNPFTMEFPAPK